MIDIFRFFLFSILFLSLISFSFSASYNQIGPRNVLNEVNNNGEAGTCADAVSPSNNANIIYIGGSNNGASTGVWKSTNGGVNWVQTPGMRDGRVYGLFILPSDSNTLFAGTPSGIYYTTNAAGSWTLDTATTGFGLTRNFLLISIDGVDTILAASENGIAYRPALPIGQASWKIFNKPSGVPGVYFISASRNGAKATVVTTIQQTVWSISIGGGSAAWTKTAMTANTVSVDPFNPNHFLASHPPDGNSANDYTIFESLDGGATSSRKSNRGGIWYVIFDPVVKNQIWIAGQQVYAKSTDGGVTFTNAFRVDTRSKQGFSMQSSFFDYQRILFNVGKYPYAVCSDQGIYGYPGSGSIITAINGDLGFTIATGVAVAKDLSSNNINVVATMWDRGPTASWDGGKTWPATEWFGSAYWKQLGAEGSPANFFEGGEIYTIGNRGPNMIAHNNNEKVYYSSNAGKDWKIVNLPSGNNVLYRSFDYYRSTSGVPTGKIWIVASGNIFVSTDYGASWSTFGTTAPPSGTNTKFVAFDPSQPSLLWAGSANCLTKTSDNGASWSSCIQPASRMTRLIIKNDGSVYFLTQEWDVPMRSTNKGSSWSTISNNDVNNAARGSNQNYASYSPSSKTLVLLAPTWAIGTVRPFIFRSFDDGNSWTEESGDITLMTNQLTNHNWYDNDLYISTGGQGILQFPNFDIAPTTTTTPAPITTTAPVTTTKAPSTTLAPTTIITTIPPTPSTFAIYWLSHQDRVVDVDNANNADGTSLKFWNPNGSNGGPGGAQLFEWIGDKSTGAQLRWVGTNKCIDNTSGNNVNGNKLIIWTCNSSNNNQKWIHLSTTNQIQWKGSNRCMDVTNGQYSPAGTLLQIYDCNPSEPNQLFILK